MTTEQIILIVGSTLLTIVISLMLGHSLYKLWDYFARKRAIKRIILQEQEGFVFKDTDESQIIISKQIEASLNQNLGKKKNG